MTTKLERSLQVMKELTLLFVAPWLLFACTAGQERTDPEQGPVDPPFSDPGTPSELTPEQQTAFEALNSIQVLGRHLYSTFPGAHHDCFPPDTSFILSRGELLIAVEVHLARHSSKIPAEQRTELAAEAVLAQEEYLVHQCGSPAVSVDLVVQNLPPSGSWILPKVLGRRDIVLEW